MVFPVINVIPVILYRFLFPMASYHKRQQESDDFINSVIKENAIKSFNSAGLFDRSKNSKMILTSIAKMTKMFVTSATFQYGNSNVPSNRTTPHYKSNHHNSGTTLCQEVVDLDKGAVESAKSPDRSYSSPLNSPDDVSKSSISNIKQSCSAMPIDNEKSQTSNSDSDTSSDNSSSSSDSSSSSNSDSDSDSDDSSDTSTNSQADSDGNSESSDEESADQIECVDENSESSDEESADQIECVDENSESSDEESADQIECVPDGIAYYDSDESCEESAGESIKDNEKRLSVDNSEQNSNASCTASDQIKLLLDNSQLFSASGNISLPLEDIFNNFVENVKPSDVELDEAEIKELLENYLNSSNNEASSEVLCLGCGCDITTSVYRHVMGKKYCQQFYDINLLRQINNFIKKVKRLESGRKKVEVQRKAEIASFEQCKACGLQFRNVEQHLRLSIACKEFCTGNKQTIPQALKSNAVRAKQMQNFGAVETCACCHKPFVRLLSHLHNVKKCRDGYGDKFKKFVEERKKLRMATKSVVKYSKHKEKLRQRQREYYHRKKANLKKSTSEE